MLHELRIQNFKGWVDTGKIRMAPITLFFGANSSGKSSIGQFLMMLKQTVESPDRKTVFYPGGKHDAVQLGSYQEMVSHRNPDNKIDFNYRWALSNPMTVIDKFSGTMFSGDSLSFQATIGLEGKGQYAPIVHSLKYDLLMDSEVRLSIGMDRTPEKKSKYTVDAKFYELKRERGRVWNPGAPVRFYGFPDQVVAYYKNADFVQEINFVHEQLFRALNYLGPLRTRTDRFYSWSGNTPASVGFSGENTVAAILASRGRKISLGYKQWSKPLERIVVESLKKMGLIEDFVVEPISEQRRGYEVKVRSKGSKDWVNLPDVGFGISQVLPVLVQCFYAPAKSIIIMEQPEIHLHPSAQSALADVMIDVINSRENGKNRNIQLIIETHSEHFLRRLQLRIAEGAISKEKVSAYFANITKTPATLEPLQIDIYGNIQNWPEMFFGDEMGDITAQAEAAIEKHIKQNARVQELS